MRDEPFDVAVTVGAGMPRRLRIVRSTVQAASLLVDKWPDKDRGPKYRFALKACMDVMEGRKAVASARRAFVGAAKEAEMLVRSKPRPEHAPK
jgi:hypothetical protein